MMARIERSPRWYRGWWIDHDPYAPRRLRWAATRRSPDTDKALLAVTAPSLEAVHAKIRLVEDELGNSREKGEGGA